MQQARPAKSSTLDRFCAYFADTMNFFHGGWGDFEAIHTLRESGLRFDTDRNIHVTWKPERTEGEVTLREGSFPTPFQHEFFPHEAHQAVFELILPKQADATTPVSIHLAATGDQGFARRRRLMAMPLAEMGFGSLILENPFYGRRKPAEQRGFSPRLFVHMWPMANAVILEALALLDWLKSQGFKNRGVTGISMGGYMAAVAASVYDEPIAAVPCIAPHSGAPVFTEGVLLKACNWKALSRLPQNQPDARAYMRYLLDGTDIRNYPAPRHPGAAIIVAGRLDAYVPAYSPAIMHEHWQGSEIRWLETGHIGAFFFHRQHFITAIRDAHIRNARVSSTTASGRTLKTGSVVASRGVL